MYFYIFSLFGCNNTMYLCGANLISFSVSIALLILMLRALRVILRDVNNILDKQDKIYFGLCIVQQLMAILLTIQADNIFSNNILRTFRLAQELIFLSFQAKMLFEDERITRAFEIISISILLFFLVFQIMIDFLYGLTTKILCGQFYWLLYSGTTATIGLCNIILGTHALTLINSYQKEGPGNTQVTYDGLQRITQDEINNRKVQLTTIILAQGISALYLIINDYLNYENPSDNCFKDDLQGALIRMFTILIGFNIPSAAIYNVFYMRNLKYFNSHQGVFEKNLGNFYDYRSEIALIDM